MRRFTPTYSGLFRFGIAWALFCIALGITIVVGWIMNIADLLGMDNILNTGDPPRVPYVRQCLGQRTGPFIAASDYMKLVPDQIRQWVPGRYIVLGTDGYGRSDSRAQLRRHFEVDTAHIVLASLRALADEGKLDMATVRACMQKYQIDPSKPNPVTQ